jgi:hypothetical protein
MNNLDYDAIVNYHGFTAEMPENKVWLAGQVRGFIIWKALSDKPEATPTEYYDFMKSLILAQKYLLCMGGE